MIASTAPRLTDGTVRLRADTGLHGYLSAHGADRVLRYGFGKAALRDVLDCVGCGRGDNVLLPAYVPDGVVEPIRESGAEPRFYPIDGALAADVGRVRAIVDDRTAALVSVNYFGFPQAALDELRAVADEHEAILVDDNAHSALSRRGDRLLGTFGHVGITSLRKLFPVPNGALLFVNDDRFDTESFSRNAVRDSFTVDDYQFSRRSISDGLQCRHQLLDTGTQVGSLVANAIRQRESSEPVSVERDPEAIYRAAKEPMSKLSCKVIERIDPQSIVRQRRENFEAWLEHLAGIPDVEPVFESLPTGVCPHVFPAVLSGGWRERFEQPPTTWPPLPADVRRSDGFGTTKSLAQSLVRLPLHSGLTYDDFLTCLGEVS